MLLFVSNTRTLFDRNGFSSLLQGTKYLKLSHPLETLFVGAIINLFSTNGFIPNHFGNCTNDETISSGTDNMNNILTDHSDNESVKDQDNHVSRPSTPLQPFVSY